MSRLIGFHLLGLHRLILAGCLLLLSVSAPAFSGRAELPVTARGHVAMTMSRGDALRTDSVRTDSVRTDSLRINSVRIDEAQAIRIALRQIAGKVLSVQLVEAVYRIKILTADGRVRTVLVDANSARVLN